MMLIGTIVNVFAVIFGSLIGLFFTRISDSMKDTVTKGIGLTVIILGLQMGMQSNNFLLVIISIAVGAVLGEIGKLDDQLTKAGNWLEKRFARKTNISQGFITATLIFCVGAMAVVGALDSGLRGDHSILYTKSLLDGFTAIILTSTLGSGVLFSSIPIFLYQGTIALFASQINRIIPADLLDLFIQEITATGGVMILAIGLNLTGITHIKVANLLPALLVVLLLIPLFTALQLI